MFNNEIKLHINQRYGFMTKLIQLSMCNATSVHHIIQSRSAPPYMRFLNGIYRCLACKIEQGRNGNMQMVRYNTVYS